MKKKIVLCIVAFFIFLSSISLSQSNKMVILFLIDGLHWQAPEKLNMPFFNSLIEEGVYINKSYMIMPHHPTIGDYSKYNSCSFPNPILHAGTIFVKPDNKYIQEVISPKYSSAFIVNTAAYRSISRGFTTAIMDINLNDEQVLIQAINVIKNQNPIFTRIHLQTPGELGRSCFETTPDKPYYRNIYGENSPYVKAIENADYLLGKLIDYLKDSGQWENTILIVSSDHGQSTIGWHPLFDEDSWMTALVMRGPGIAVGRRLPYFEHTDLATTISWLLGLPSPNLDGGAGKVIKEILESNDAKNYNHPKYIKKINSQIKEYNLLRAEMLLRAEKDRYFSNIIASLENENLTPNPFYHQDRIMDWHLSGSTEHLIEANEKILQQMRKELNAE